MNCNNCPTKGIQISNIQENHDKLFQSDNAYDWMKAPSAPGDSNLVEISFKNNRKDFYINKKELVIKKGDYVAVQCESGHGIGIVSLTGKIAELQLNKKSYQQPEKIVYRLATKVDIEKLIKVRLKEKPVMVKARQIAELLGLEMKISDVEFQGDGTKATFFYIADGRVDFRELIKLYAKEFGVKIEMRQIGARQESGLIGGIGSCGRELCCSSWRNKYDTVSAQAAKVQELSHHTEKLTGQCGKLKCCLIYEIDQYIEANLDFPDQLLELETNKGTAYPQKKDILKKIIWYSIGTKDAVELISLTTENVKEIIQLNKKGIKPEIKSHKIQANNFIISEAENSLKDEYSKKSNPVKRRKSNTKK